MMPKEIRLYRSEDLLQLVDSIVSTFCGYGFTDWGQAVRDVDKIAAEGDLELEEEYTEELLLEAEKLALPIARKLSKLYGEEYANLHTKLSSKHSINPEMLTDIWMKGEWWFK